MEGLVNIMDLHPWMHKNIYLYPHLPLHQKDPSDRPVTNAFSPLWSVSIAPAYKPQGLYGVILDPLNYCYIVDEIYVHVFICFGSK